MTENKVNYNSMRKWGNKNVFKTTSLFSVNTNIQNYCNDLTQYNEVLTKRIKQQINLVVWKYNHFQSVSLKIIISSENRLRNFTSVGFWDLWKWTELKSEL